MFKFESIPSVSKAIAQLRQGDVLFLDIDETLILCGLLKYEDPVELTEQDLPTLIKNLQESNIPVYGLTARQAKFTEHTLQQLKTVDIVFSEIIYAPNLKNKTPQKGQALLNWFLATPKGLRPKRILMIDDQKQQLEGIESSFNQQADVSVIGYHYQRPHYQPLTKHDAFPITLDLYTKIQSLGGGTNSTFEIMDVNSEKKSLVLKIGVHPDALKTEILCNALYRVLGVSVPGSQIYNTLPTELARQCRLAKAHGLFQVTQFLSKSPCDESELILEAQQHFVAHALLGNIDVAKPENFIGTTLIDVGANFLFRAKGEERAEKPSLVSEIDSLREAKYPRSFKWFGEVTDEQIQSQVLSILKKQEELEQVLWQVSAELKFTPEIRSLFLQSFADRLDNLVTRFCPDDRLGARLDRKPHPDFTAAGILSFTLIQDKPHILLAKRVRHDWSDNFGGKSDESDQWLYETAAREVAEESNNLFHYTPNELIDSPFHDLITTKKGKPFVYRMYIAEHEWVNPTFFNDREHMHYAWVPIESVNEAIERARPLLVEGEETIAVQLADHADIVLYPPLYQMLKQHVVQNNIKAILAKEKLHQTHSQSSKLGTNPESQYRVLQSPKAKQEQIINTLINHSQLIREFKSKSNQHDDGELPIAPLSSPRLSQSQLHLKVVLGNDYSAEETQSNIAKALAKSDLTIEESRKESLIAQLAELVVIEKKNPDCTYFYHACDEKVAFAYQVYSQLYQCLKMDDQWSALRGLNKFFAKFPNMQEVIRHYSPGGVAIHNFSEDYHEIVISTNLFLFGNKEVRTSYSLAYLVDNFTRRSVDLETMLTSFLHALGASEHEVEKLLTLFERYFKGKGGVLYQIALSNEEASKMSYAAGRAGALQPYLGRSDPVEILKQLEEKTQHSGLDAEDMEYINTLQARVLIPPHQFLKMKMVRYHAFSTEENKAFTAELHQVVQGIVRGLLQAINQGKRSVIHSTVPMGRILSQVNKANFLDQKEINLTEELSQAIFSVDLIQIKTLLQANPELKRTRLLPKVNYLNRVGKEKKRFPIELMVKMKQAEYNNQFIKECFGSTWIEDYFFEKTKINWLVIQIDFTKKWDIVEELINLDRIERLSQKHVHALLLGAFSGEQWNIVEHIIALTSENKPSESVIDPLLQGAVQSGKIKLVKFLIQMSGENKPTQEGVAMALGLALELPQTGCVELLIGMTGDNRPSPTMISRVFVLAVEKNNWDCAVLLIVARPEVNSLASLNIDQAFIEAAGSGAVNALKFFIDLPGHQLSKASIEHALSNASCNHKWDCVALIVAMTGENSVRREGIDAAFRCAVKSRVDDAVKLFIEMSGENKPSKSCVEQKLSDAVISRIPNFVQLLISMTGDNKPSQEFIDNLMIGSSEIYVPDCVESFVQMRGKNRPSQKAIETALQNLTKQDSSWGVDVLNSVRAIINMTENQPSQKIIEKALNNAFQVCQYSSVLAFLQMTGENAPSDTVVSEIYTIYLNRENFWNNSDSCKSKNSPQKLIILIRLIEMSDPTRPLLAKQLIKLLFYAIELVGAAKDDRTHLIDHGLYNPLIIIQECLKKITDENIMTPDEIQPVMHTLHEKTQYFIEVNPEYCSTIFVRISTQFFSGFDLMSQFVSDETLYIGMLQIDPSSGLTPIHLAYKQFMLKNPESEGISKENLPTTNLTQLLLLIYANNPAVIKRCLTVLAQWYISEACMALALIASDANERESYLNQLKRSGSPSFFSLKNPEIESALLSADSSKIAGNDPRNVRGFIENFRGEIECITGPSTRSCSLNS